VTGNVEFILKKMKGFGCAMDIVKVGRYPVMENATMNIGN
jgi:hypothetical protein